MTRPAKKTPDLKPVKTKPRLRVPNSVKDDLLRYAERVMEKSLMDMRTPFFGLQMFGPAACVVLDREGPYQAELCIFPPSIPIPHHAHPDVDSIEIQITGSLRLFINGKDMMRGAKMEGFESMFQKIGLRIPAMADHDVEVGPNGAVFLSVQRWNQGTPDHVGHNWQGVTYSKDQRDRLDANNT